MRETGGRLFVSIIYGLTLTLLICGFPTAAVASTDLPSAAARDAATGQAAAIERLEIALVVEVLERSGAPGRAEATVQIHRVLVSNDAFQAEPFRRGGAGRFRLRETPGQRIPPAGATIFVALRYDHNGVLTFAGESDNIAFYLGDHAEMKEIYEPSGDPAPVLKQFNDVLAENRPTAPHGEPVSERRAGSVLWIPFAAVSAVALAAALFARRKGGPNDS